MIWRIEYRDEAHADITAAFHWYEKHQRGVGQKFIDAVIRSVRKLSENPFSFRLRSKKHRVYGCLLKRFPYRVLYQIHGDTVSIIAIAHAARHDRTWKNRI